MTTNETLWEHAIANEDYELADDYAIEKRYSAQRLEHYKAVYLGESALLGDRFHDDEPIANTQS